ncbi:hypothetical protein [Brasilonema bromeliae]|uniref:hypothetical protein n=1 Tax=Brasilonema bromeliae TaxID=383615 RepID=UPI00145E2439|nr:hypothetical protein [Brasilonema bromeliae]
MTDGLLCSSWVSNSVESMGGIIRRTSQLDPSVPISVHSAPDVLGFPLAHVDVVVTAFMYR